jgi:NADPH-dependent curcumin reductase CurA
MTATGQGRPSHDATRWVLARRVAGGLPDKSTFQKQPVKLAPLLNGQLLVRTTYVSLEPHTAGEIGPPRRRASPGWRLLGVADACGRPSRPGRR